MTYKKTIIIISIFIILFAIGAVLYFLTAPSKEAAEQEVSPSIFPFAKEPAEQPGISQPEEITPLSPATSPQAQILTRLSENAVAGAAFKDNKIRYAERATGHVYEIAPDGQSRVRISNTTIPKVFNVIWSYDKDYAVIQYLETDENSGQNIIQNFAAFFTGSSTQGILLPKNIISLATAPTENGLLYFIPYADANILIRASFENTNQKQVAATPFSEFKVFWPSQKFAALLSKPASFADGFLYKVNIAAGGLEKILGNIKGLNALWSPNADKLLFSKAGGENPSLSMLDLKTGKSASLDLRTLAEKCAWSALEKDTIYCGQPIELPKGDYPEIWYQGLVTFNDRAVRKNCATGEMTILNLPEHDNFDIINLFLSDDEGYLFFTNKKDGSLWSLELVR